MRYNDIKYIFNNNIMSKINDRFNKAKLFIKFGEKTAKSDENSIKLKLYSHFKCATVGPCSIYGGTQPWVVQLEARAKWDAWNELGEISQDVAKTQYCEILNEINPEWEKQSFTE